MCSGAVKKFYFEKEGQRNSYILRIISARAYAMSFS